MSKFFDQTRKAQQWAREEETSRGTEIERMLEAVKKADAVSTEVAESRFRGSRKLRLARPVGTPMISVNGAGSDELGQAALESYRGLRMRLLRLQTSQGLRSVVISSAAPEEGKTLTSMNLALCCAQLHDLRILLVDSDLRTRGLTHLLNYPSGPGLAEVLTGEARFEDAVLATDLPNLYAVSAGNATASIPELLSSPRWKEFIGWCGESFKLILVDSPPILPLADFELISAGCDGVLMVVLALSTQREVLRKAATQIDSKKLLGVVFNATENGDSNPYYYRSYGGKTSKRTR